MHTPSRHRSIAALVALSLSASACADPPTLPAVTVQVTGIRETIRGREAGLGDVGVELVFTGFGSSTGTMLKRIALYHGADSEKFTVQIPDGQYSMAVNIYTVVDCSGVARQQILGTQTTVLMVSTPQSPGTWVTSPVTRGAGLSPCR
jgi:hypothetical protein